MTTLFRITLTLLAVFAAAGFTPVAAQTPSPAGAKIYFINLKDGDTVAFRIQDYLHFAPGPNVAALCIILVVLSGAVLGLVGAWAWRERE